MAMGDVAGIAGPADNRRAFHTDHCFLSMSGSSAVLQWEADFVSMDSDGFTVDIESSTAFSPAVSYIALKGGQYAVGNDTQKQSTGTKSTTGLGFEPVLAFFGSANAVTADPTTTGWKVMLGITDMTTDRVMWSHSLNGTTGNDSAQYYNGRVIYLGDFDGSSVITEDAEADGESFDSDGFTLDYVVALAVANLFGYVGIGSAESGQSPAQVSNVAREQAMAMMAGL